MNRDDWPVKEYGNVLGECRYCGAKIGEQHRKGCVIRKRTVVVEITVQLVRAVPEDFDKDMIEFGMNEGSACSDNIIDEITEAAERRDGLDRCSCPVVTGKYVREATKEDEEFDVLFIKDLKS
jgi:hypothetical protein